MAPLILTLKFDSESQARLEKVRKQHFPPERNRVPAHLTLFHQLPDLDTTRDTVESIARRFALFSVGVTGLRALGRGTAYTVDSAALLNLHNQLSTAFSADLIPQDRQTFRPHVVVQNFVDRECARRTLAELTSVFEPYEVLALGLDLWIYQNGPWLFERTFSFSEGVSPVM